MNKIQLSAVHRLFRGRQNVYISSLLRQHGYQYKVAFGLTLPDIKELVKQMQAALTDPESALYGLTEVELAESLWADDDIRESKMSAPLLYPRGEMDLATAERWAESIPTPEVADVVCMYAYQFGIGQSLIERWRESEDRMKRYCAQSLIKRLS